MSSPQEASRSLHSHFDPCWDGFISSLMEFMGRRHAELLPELCFALPDATDAMDHNLSRLVDQCTYTDSGYSYGNQNSCYVDWQELHRRYYAEVVARWSEFVWSFLNLARYGTDEILPFPGKMNNPDLIQAFFRAAAERDEKIVQLIVDKPHTREETTPKEMEVRATGRILTLE